jgi:Flp pilus assembly CpaE family ATPase
VSSARRAEATQKGVWDMTAIEFTTFDVLFIGANLVYLFILSAMAHVRCGKMSERIDELEKRK